MYLHNNSSFFDKSRHLQMSWVTWLILQLKILKHMVTTLAHAEQQERAFDVKILMYFLKQIFIGQKLGHGK